MYNMGTKLWFLFGFLCIFQWTPLVSTKLYRVERYNMYNCDKAKNNEYVVFNKATMRIFGGKDKMVYDGYFEILQDITEEIKVSFLLKIINFYKKV
jgi:lysozyme family protein